METTDPSLNSYIGVVKSFKEGMMRIWGAEAAYARLVCALISFNSLGRPMVEVEGPIAGVAKNLSKIRYSSFESLAHVTDTSHLVYATSLLDSFLTDTVVFLFMRIPRAMGKNQQVSLQTLIESSSKTEVISRLAIARAREISYLPFAGRLQFLRDTFGLKIEICTDTLESLNRFATIRNTAVHDQSILNLYLDDTGHVLTTARPLEKIASDELHSAIETYGKVALSVYQSVFRQVLKVEDHPVVSKIINTSAVELG